VALWALGFVRASVRARNGVCGSGISLTNTVAENSEGFNQRENDDAKSARRGLGMVGYPSPKDFKNMVRSNMIKNCPITLSNIAAANKIFGPDVASLKGKTTRTTPKPVLIDYVNIPKEIIDINKEVTFAADVMFVDGLPFLASTSHKIKFTNTEYVSRRTKPILVKSLNKILSLYSNREFKVTTALMDREFESL
jgi:hypothetical protein